jgi:hypothetical protein
MKQAKILNKQKKLTLGIKFIIGFHILNIIIWVVGQGGAAVAYDTVAQWGFQEARETIDPIILVINRGIGLADFIIGVPIFIFATIGLWQMRFYGQMTSFMVLGISFYWTMVAWIKQHFYIQAGVKCEPFAVGTHGMLGFVFLFSLWASWYLYKNRKLFD